MVFFRRLRGRAWDCAAGIIAVAPVLPLLKVIKTAVSQINILFVEDDLEFATFVKSYLAKHGFMVTTVATGGEFLHELDSHVYECAVVDLTLPDEDGIVLVRKLRARSAMPIIILTGREGIDDKLACFQVGADDYLTKPADPRELVVRVQALLRRAAASSGKDNILHVGSIALDIGRREASDKDGAIIDFTPAEFSLLWVLARAGGNILARRYIVDAVSSGDGPISTRAIDILVSRIRKKIGKDVILTAPNAGYRCGWPVSNGEGNSPTD